MAKKARNDNLLTTIRYKALLIAVSALIVYVMFTWVTFDPTFLWQKENSGERSIFLVATIFLSWLLDFFLFVHKETGGL